MNTPPQKKNRTVIIWMYLFASRAVDLPEAKTLSLSSLALPEEKFVSELLGNTLGAHLQIHSHAHCRTLTGAAKDHCVPVLVTSIIIV